MAMSDELPLAVWSMHFLRSQGYATPAVLIHQDNMSTIALSNKGKSTSDRTRHISIRYFWVHDLIKRGEANVQYCPTLEMLADVLTKPLQGDHFIGLRDKLLGV